MNTSQRREAAAKRGLALVKSIQSEKREPTAAESASMKAECDEIEECDKILDGVKADDDRFNRLNSAGPVKGTGKQAEDYPDHAGYGRTFGTSAKAGFLNLRMDAGAVKSAATAPSGRTGVKALIAEGQSSTNLRIDSGIVVEGRPAASVLDIIPALTVDQPPNYGYLKQVTRTNNAAPVAKGGVKPTSKYGLERMDGKLQVIAHLSEPIDVYDLQDNGSLETFLRSELGAGIADALIAQIMTGSGVAPNLTGLSNVSGILQQAFAVDAFVSLRKSLTSLETLGLNASGILMNPNDWEAVELAREDGATGAFLLNNGPVDVAKRRLWGVPVAASSGVTEGTAWVFSEGAAHIRTDGRPLEVSWGLVGDDFSKNQVRARVEGRFDLSVERPGGIVEVALA